MVPARVRSWWILLFGVGLAVVLCDPCPRPVAADSQQESALAAVKDLLRRVAPEHADRFTLEVIPPDNNQDVFEIESSVNKTVVRGSSGVALAAGIGWYAKHYCHCDPSWRDPRLSLPASLPRVRPKVRLATPYAHRYFFNYCAFSYTMAWWDWSQWEHMIDWMALNGINMPLAVTGQEAVWQSWGRKLGLTDAEIGEFLVGPAYLPFGWMGCIDGWGGPLPRSWIDSHRELGQKIVARERALGMKPVLQGFTGHVPVALKRVFPRAKFQRLPSWCGFPGTFFLDPLDPLFRRLGGEFVREQTQLFGADHLYASDTFIEMSPPSDDPQFLDAMGKAVFGAMRDADPQATWVMQGWLFVNNPRFWQPPQAQALLTSVPHGRLLVLDLMCESRPAWKLTQAFRGQPWAFGIIQTFGDTVSLHGGLPQIAANLREARTAPDAGDLRGLGHIMEGLGCNPVVHDFLADMTWRTEVPEVEDWLAQYVRRRYGREQPQAWEAWKCLLRSAYASPGSAGDVICARPGLNISGGSTDTRVAQAWRLLLEASGDLQRVDAYQFDLVHVGRQYLSNLAKHYHGATASAYRKHDRAALSAARTRFLELVNDIDDLLATRGEFLLGRWLSDAKRWAQDERERRLYEWNARNQITLWGPPEGVLHDYARKQWSGMLRSFYHGRWTLFFDHLDASLAAGTAWDAARYAKEIQAWEDQWTRAAQEFPREPSGDPVRVSRRLFDKYGGVVLARDAESLTTNKPCACSHALDSHPAPLANDGWASDTDSYWATDVNLAKDAWWQVDLERPTAVGRVVVVLYFGDTRHYGFTVETSLDGAKWELAADHTDNRELSTSAGFECRFPPRQVRFLRVNVTSNSANTGRHLVEVMAFEK